MADSWANISLGSVIPGFVPSLIGPAAAAAQGVGSVLSASIGIAQAVEAIVIDAVDPVASLVQGIVQQIETQVADLVNTGVYVTAVVPKSLNDRKGTKQVIEDIINSFYDQFDPRRPLYEDGEAVGAVLLMAGGADITKALPGAALLHTLFALNSLANFMKLNNNAYVPQKVPFDGGGGVVTGIPSGQNPRAFFQDLSRADKYDMFARLRLYWASGKNQGLITRIKGFDPQTRTFEVVPMPFNIETGDTYVMFNKQGGRPPDWKSVRIVDLVPSLGVLFLQLQGMTRLLSAAVTSTGAIKAFVDALQAKAKQLVRTTEAVRNNLLQLETLLQGSGVSVLRLPPQVGGLPVLSQRMLAAKNAPPFADSEDFTICVILVGNEPEFQVLSRIF